MADNGEQLLAAEHGGLVVIRVSGRATFRIAQDLRNYLRRVMERQVRRIVFDLRDCESMDSTFMGVLAMIALDMGERGRIAILNACEHVRELLDDIGLSEMFDFLEAGDTEGIDWAELHRVTAGRDAAAGANAEEADMARTVLEAHETLMQISEDNVPKFRTVVDLLREEMQAGENESTPGPNGGESQ